MMRKIGFLDNMMRMTAGDADGTSSSSEQLQQQSNSNTARAPPELDEVSRSYTPGEITFVSILSFAVIAVIGVAVYVWITKRRRNAEEKAAAEANNKETTAPTQRISTQDASCIIEMEAGVLDRYCTVPTGTMPRRGSHLSSGMDSQLSGSEGMSRHSSRRSSMDPNRRGSLNSLTSNVSSEYKLAAMEHMNQISQSGRHM
jgi:hypothetical protein